MKKFILRVFILIGYCSLNAQVLLFDTESSNLSDLSTEQSTQFSKLQANTNVDEIYSINVINDILNSNEISFEIDNALIVVHLLKENIRSKKNYSWFGETAEGEGVFFYVNNGKIASKFNLGEYSYTLIPLRDGSHMLIKFNSTDIGICGTTEVNESLLSTSSENNNLLDDSECTLRVLIATTPTARQEISNSGFDIPTFAQVAVDETNMVYVSSQINITMELATLIETNYNEHTGDNHATDVSRFRNGTNDLRITHTSREIYKTDIQVLVRRNEPGIFGRAFYIPTDNDPLDESKAFCTVSVDGVTDGRFSFTHEIGHLQGGRHENHNDNPSYARGFLSSNNINAWRTIMTRTGAAPCTQANSCRIGVFSNPNVNDLRGVPAGANDRHNARRINETSIGINNFRKAQTILLLNDETITSNQVSHHLAKSTIDTDNRILIYQTGSFSTMRSGEKIVLRPGTDIQQGAEFQAYITNLPCESLPNFRQAQDFSPNEVSNELLNDFVMEDLEVKIYPNPTNGTINVLFNSKDQSKYHIKIYDTKSNILFENSYLESSTQIDVNHLKEGFYFFEISKDNIQLIKKIIKK